MFGDILKLLAKTKKGSTLISTSSSSLSKAIQNFLSKISF